MTTHAILTTLVNEPGMLFHLTKVYSEQRANISYMPKDTRTGYVQSWHFTLQRALSKNMLLDVAYVGNMGRHLMYGRDLNQLPLGATVNNPNLLPSVNGTTCS